MRWLAVVALVMGCMFVIRPAAAGDKRVALVVGESNYRWVPSLPNPKRDAKAIAETLRQLGWDVDVVADGTDAQLHVALRQFSRKVDDASAAIFYYAGHGMQVDGNNYLIPIDAKLEDLRDIVDETVDVNEVLKKMEGDKRVNLVFLDACRDNPFAEHLRSLARSRGRSIDLTRGLAQMDAPAGTVVAYATEAGKSALDGEGEHSPYTTALLAELPKPGVMFESMMKQVHRRVMEMTDGKQVPFEYGSLIGDFYFIQVVNPPPPADTGADERVFWQSIANSTNPAELQAYLRRYPNGTFADLARTRLAALQSAAAPTTGTKEVVGAKIAKDAPGEASSPQPLVVSPQPGNSLAGPNAPTQPPPSQTAALTVSPQPKPPQSVPAPPSALTQSTSPASYAGTYEGHIEVGKDSRGFCQTADRLFGLVIGSSGDAHMVYDQRLGLMFEGSVDQNGLINMRYNRSYGGVIVFSGNIVGDQIKGSSNNYGGGGCAIEYNLTRRRP